MCVHVSARERRTCHTHTTRAAREAFKATVFFASLVLALLEFGLFSCSSVVVVFWSWKSMKNDDL